jgi:hypothetical protein
MDLTNLATHPGAGQLAVEAGIVGIVFTLLFMLIHIIVMYADDRIAMSHLGMAIVAFLTAIAGHLVFEFTGLNDKFINNRI